MKHITAVSDLHDKLADLGASGLLKVLSQIAAGTSVAIKQDESLVTYAEKAGQKRSLNKLESFSNRN